MEPDRKAVEDLIKEKENQKVSLVAGVINATGKMFYWKDELGLEIGAYAIVQNMNGYDLIKVIGRVSTTKTNVSKFSNTKYGDMKQTILEIHI